MIFQSATRWLVCAALIFSAFPAQADDLDDDAVQPQTGAAAHHGPFVPESSALDGASETGAPLPPVFHALRGAPLPLFLRGTLTPPQPFPLVISGSADGLTTLAPGIRRFSEHLYTTSGPLQIHGLLVDPRAPGIHLRTVLAHDRITSSGETVSSMVRRTGAIAGINGDYFAIHQTNEPLGIVINNGLLERTPGRRVALALSDDGMIHIAPFSFHGTATWGGTSAPLTGVNSWPPDGGASLVLPTYGVPRPAGGVLFVPLAPVQTTAEGQTYRATADASPIAPAGTLGLALGPAALRYGNAPEAGDTVVINESTVPDLRGVVTAIGGGPQLLADHDVTRDEDDPLDDETGTRFPLSGLGRQDDGELLMLAVDGRAPNFSVGLTRPEFGSLFASLGTADAMCLDSGGSTTLVAKLPATGVHVENHPSGGHERAVGDALLVYRAGAEDGQLDAVPAAINVRPDAPAAPVATPADADNEVGP